MMARWKTWPARMGTERARHRGRGGLHEETTEVAAIAVAASAARVGSGALLEERSSRQRRGRGDGDRIGGRSFHCSDLGDGLMEMIVDLVEKEDKRSRV